VRRRTYALLAIGFVATVVAVVTLSTIQSPRSHAPATSGAASTSVSSLQASDSSTVPENAVRAPILEVHRASSTELQVTYEGSMCEPAAGHRVIFSDDEVVIEMFEGPPIGPDCYGGIAYRTEIVVLDQPVGSRRIVDGACAPEEPYSGSSTCEKGFVTT
jgi:hypothetical protein